MKKIRDYLKKRFKKKIKSEYLIDLHLEDIYYVKTKKYFQEVLSSFINGNFRSAVVVLWTITVCDLIFKLQDLSSIYDDTIAEKILEEIKKKKEKNSKSPEWEIFLIDQISERTHMFEVYEINYIRELHKYRHLSAHPVIKEDLSLYQPNEVTTKALIKNIFESVLTKPPMASNKIFEGMRNDLEEKRDLFPNINDLELYLNRKYFKLIPNKVKQYIFKQFWKFVFKLNDAPCKRNRKINLHTIKILYKQNYILLDELISIENDYFSSNINLNVNMKMNALVSFFSEYPKAFKLLDKSIHSPIIERIKKDKKLWAKAFFIFKTPNDYFDTLKNEIFIDVVIDSKSLYKTISEYFKENEMYEDFIKLCIESYIKSSSFTEADMKFSELIVPIIDSLTKDDIIYLIKGIDSNRQVYHRLAAQRDHKILKTKCDDLINNFDYAPYKNFMEYLEE